jgi:hypothetical protein
VKLNEQGGGITEDLQQYTKHLGSNEKWHEKDIYNTN